MTASGKSQPPVIGIDLALLLNGIPFRLPDGGHPEAGHIAVGGSSQACYCGLIGCWETAASRLALEIMLRSGAGDSHRPALPYAARLAAEGNAEYQGIFEAYGYQVGRGLSILQGVYGPDVTVIAGSVAEYLDLLAPGIERALRRSPEFQSSVALTAAGLGPTAGAVGAAVLALRSHGGL